MVSAKKGKKTKTQAKKPSTALAVASTPRLAKPRPAKAQDWKATAYRDYRGAAKESGLTLHAIFALLNMGVFAALRKALPANVFEALCARVEPRLNALPHERVISPPPRVAGPLLAHYPFVADESERDLRDLFENLLAASMDRDGSSHPSHVEILKQLTCDEAKICKDLVRLVDLYNGVRLPIVRFELHSGIGGVRSLSGFACDVDFVEGLTDRNQVAVHLDNLERLGVLAIDYVNHAVLPDEYVRLEASEFATLANQRATATGRRVESVRGCITMTEFGLRFLRVCVPDAAFWSKRAAMSV